MSSQVPSTQRVILVTKVGTNFRDVTKIVEQPIPKLEPQQVLMKAKWLAINASDVNIAGGNFYRDQVLELPYGVGFEGMGEVAGLGSGVTNLKVGQTAGYMKPNGSFADYCVVQAENVMPFPTLDPKFFSIMLSGLTASISLEVEGEIKAGQTVLITAAAGGTGQIAVQLCKLKGCTVIGTCSTPEKAAYLKSIGCDRPINYKEENVEEVIAKEYPKGLDVVYECVGKAMFDAAMKNIAFHGRILIIGQISTYETKGYRSSELVKPESKYPIGMNLLLSSASLRGFHLNQYMEHWGPHLMKLSKLFQEGKLKVVTSSGSGVNFKGLEGVADAVEYMYSGKNTGKVVVEM